MRDPEPPPIRRGPASFGPLGDEPENGDFMLGDDESDRGLLRVVGVIAALGILIAILLLPPVSLLDRGGGESGGGITTRARDELPALPDGLTARSQLYDIEVDESLAGPATLTVRLSDRAEEGEHLGFYTIEGGEWRRLGAVTVIDDGGATQGQVEAVPANIAVLSRTAFASSLGLLVGPGEAPDPAVAAAAGIIAVVAASPTVTEGGDQAVVLVEPGALDRALAAGGEAQVYLGVTADDAAAAEAVDRILATPSLSDSLIEALLSAATDSGASGLLLDYGALDPSRTGPFTSLVTRLGDRARADGLGLIVAVPTPAGSDFGAYDWAALTEAADAIWLRAPADGGAYYDQLETALSAQQEAGIDLGRVALIIDRRSYERFADGIRPLTLEDSLALASLLRGRADGAIGPGDAVSIAGLNIDRDAGNSGLQWDDRARAVSFAYAGRGGPRTIWVENRFSTAFRLDLAQRFNLGGIAVDAAAEDARLPDLWETVLRFVEDGSLVLELPYGPYLEPQWSISDGLIEGSGDRGVIVWRAPERVGTYDVTLVVSDGVVFVGQQIVLRVSDETPVAPTAGAPAGDSEDAAGDGAAADGSEASTDDGDGAAAEDDGDAAPTPEPTTEAPPEPTVEPTPEASATPSTPPGPAGN